MSWLTNSTNHIGTLSHLLLAILWVEKLMKLIDSNWMLFYLLRKLSTRKIFLTYTMHWNVQHWKNNSKKKYSNHFNWIEILVIFSTVKLCVLHRYLLIFGMVSADVQAFIYYLEAGSKSKKKNIILLTHWSRITPHPYVVIRFPAGRKAFQRLLNIFREERRRWTVLIIIIRLKILFLAMCFHFICMYSLY